MKQAVQSRKSSLVQKRNNDKQSKEKGFQNKSATQTKVTNFMKSKSASNSYMPSHPQQKEFIKNLVLSIACDQLPLSIVESPTYRKLMLDLDPR